MSVSAAAGWPFVAYKTDNPEYYKQYRCGKNSPYTKYIKPVHRNAPPSIPSW